MAGPATDRPTDAAMVQSVESRVKTLLEEGDVGRAREVVLEAQKAETDPAGLLWTLADIDFAAGELPAGRSRVAEAFAASAKDADATTRRIRALSRNGLWRDALLAVEAIPAELRGDALVCAEAGAFYQHCGCYAHAADVYGSPRSLGRLARIPRRLCWLRSGGPLASVRRNVRTWEEARLLPVLLRSSSTAAHLHGIAGVDAAHADTLQIQLDQLTYRLYRRWYHWNAVGRIGYHLLPLAVLPVWLVLLLVVNEAGFSTGIWSSAYAAGVSAAISTASAVFIAMLLVKSNGQLRFLSRISARSVLIYFFMVAMLEAVVGEAYDNRVLPIAGWWSWVILGFTVSPAAIACLPIAGAIFGGIWQLGYRRLVREDCLLTVLDLLMDVLDDLRSTQGNHCFAIHLRNAEYLELAARRLARDLFPPGLVSYLGSGDWLARRAAGWAEALRHAQRQLMASTPENRVKLEAFIAHEIRCLANCDLGALSWREPPPPPPRRAIVRRRAIAIVRTVLVAGLPLAAVLTVQQFVHTNPGFFGWARITTGIWALLYVLLGIDPAIREKIDTAQQVATFLRPTQAVGGAGDQRRERTT